MNDPCHPLIVYRWLTMATIHETISLNISWWLKRRRLKMMWSKAFVLDFQPYNIILKKYINHFVEKVLVRLNALQNSNLPFYNSVFLIIIYLIAA